jgi:3-phenylpropionate/trans-cinnamate dioxygenase ferredoxin subunit
MNYSQAEAAAASVDSGASTGSNLSAGEHVVAQASDLKPGEHKIVQIRSLEIGIYNVGGSFYAHHSMCPHQFGPACLGPVTGQSVCDESTGWRFQWRRNNEILVCPWHGMQFDILTGQSLPNKNVRLRTFPVRVVDGEIRVQVGGRSARAAT